MTTADLGAQSLARLLLAHAADDGSAALTELRALCAGPRGAVGVILDLAHLVTKMGVDQYGDDWSNVLNLTHLELEFDAESGGDEVAS